MSLDLDVDLNNEVLIDSSAIFNESVKFKIKGFNNKITVSKKTVLRNISVEINGSNNNLFIGEFCNLRGSIHLRQMGSLIEIGAKTTFVNAHLFAMEGKRIVIGEDCMFSSGVYIRTSDEHSILDLTNNTRVNIAKDICVGSHVWIGEGATLSKGSLIPDNCIIGARSVVTKVLHKKNSIYAGCPATIIRDNIRWIRELI